MNNITDSQRLEALTKLSLQMMTQYHERRNLEWKIHVLIWTLISVFTYFSVTSNVKMNICVFAFFIGLLVIIHFFWTFMMQVSQAIDKDQSLIYRLAADALLSNQPMPTITNPNINNSSWAKWRKYKQYKWALVIIGTTATMGLAAIFLMLRVVNS